MHVHPTGPVFLSSDLQIMAITKAKKEVILAQLMDIKKDSESIVFVHFNKLPVKDSTLMRTALRKEGVGFLVAKKTLMKRAFGEGYEGTMPELDGEIAVAYSTDAIAPAQNIKEFAGKYKDQLAIVGGIFQGVFKSKEEMTEIASIPPLQTLRGMFAQLINSPRQRFAVVLSKVAETK
jgi:large subunit ribosomal protein L10